MRKPWPPDQGRLPTEGGSATRAPVAPFDPDGVAPDEDSRQTLIIRSGPAGEGGAPRSLGTGEATWHIEDASPGGRRPAKTGGPESGRGILPGSLIDGTYRVLRELGRGGTGIVYLAEDVALRRSVAVKVLLPRYGSGARHAERFRREARMMAAIDDENVVHIHALGDHGGLPYLVMDYIMGETLARFLAGMQAAYENVPIDLAYALGRQLCRALSAVHAAGIVHRDVKPGNVMVTAGPRAILMDFSLARDADAVPLAGRMVGTPDYVAPEQLRGRFLSGADGQRSDIYSLGVTLFEMMTGRLPFRERHTEDAELHLWRTPPVPSEVRPDLAPAFDAVLLRAIARTPADRWSSCDELGEALAHAYRASLGVAPRRVLIVSGSAGDGQALSRMVSAWISGTEIRVLAGGKEALGEALHQRPALILLDLADVERSPPVDLVAALRGSPETARVPVVVLSGGHSSQRPDQEFLRALGARAVMKRPIDPVRLAALLRVILSGDAAVALT